MSMTAAIRSSVYSGESSLLLWSLLMYWTPIFYLNAFVYSKTLSINSMIINTNWYFLNSNIEVNSLLTIMNNYYSMEFLQWEENQEDVGQ